MLPPRAPVFGGCGRLGHLGTGDEKRAFVAALRAPVASLRSCGLSARPGPEVPVVTGGAESFRGPTSGVSGTHRTGAGRGRVLLLRRGVGTKLSECARCLGASNSGGRVWLGRGVGGGGSHCRGEGRRRGPGLWREPPAGNTR